MGFKLTPRQRDRVFNVLAEAQRNGDWIVCAGCGVAFPARNVDVDHIVALSAGGVHSILNCILLCVQCNRVKSATHTLESLRAKLIDENQMHNLHEAEEAEMKARQAAWHDHTEGNADPKHLEMRNAPRGASAWRNTNDPKWR